MQPHLPLGQPRLTVAILGLAVEAGGDDLVAGKGLYFGLLVSWLQLSRSSLDAPAGIEGY